VEARAACGDDDDMSVTLDSDTTGVVTFTGTVEFGA
jgi:hypothetical protein